MLENDSFASFLFCRYLPLCGVVFVSMLTFDDWSF